MGIQRKSYSEIGNRFFFTTTIHQWYPLLSETQNKNMVVKYLKQRSDKGFIKIFSFVCMPNHVYIIRQKLKIK